MLLPIIITFLSLLNEAILADNSYETSYQWFSFCNLKGENHDILTCDKCIIEHQNVTSNNATWFQSKSLNNCLLLFNDKTSKIKFDKSLSSYNLSNRLIKIPYLTNKWLNNELYSVIISNELVNNFNFQNVNNSDGNISDINKFYVNKLVKNLKIIELNNLGIEIIAKYAFENFFKLKVLRLNNNLISNLDFTSFSKSNLINQDGDENDDEIEDDDTSGTATAGNFNGYDDDEEHDQKLNVELIELDLSNNKISTIKLENIMYLENLKILNLSHNYIKQIDLKLISLVAPHLQVFDISYNLIKKFNFFINNNLHQHNQFNSYNYKLLINNYYQNYQLLFNYLLKDLVYINLYGNLLNSLIDVFSLIDINYILSYEADFCDLFKSINEDELSLLYLKRTSPLHINFKNNTWKCSCESFEFLVSIIDSYRFNLNNRLIPLMGVNTLDLVKNGLVYDTNFMTNSLLGNNFDEETSTADDMIINANNSEGYSKTSNYYNNKYVNSCFINVLFKKLNFFSLNQNQNIESLKHLTCYNESKFVHNWYLWYKTSCLNNSFTATTKTTPRYLNSTRSISPQMLNLTTNYNNGTTIVVLVNSSASTTTLATPIAITTSAKYLNSTKFYKYDVSSAFYWVSSICIAIITISCLFTAWFYCWKRYRLSRRIMLDTNSLNNLSANSICRNNTATALQRRNIYLVNARYQPPGVNQQNSSNDTSPPAEITQNLSSTSTTQTYRTSLSASYWSSNHNNDENTNNSNTGNNNNVNGLYYISLNRERNIFNDNILSLDTISNCSDTNNMNSNHGMFYNLHDDEPPNYYEAISIKHNSVNRYATNKNFIRSSNMRNSRTNNIARSSGTTAARAISRSRSRPNVTTSTNTTTATIATSTTQSETTATTPILQIHTNNDNNGDDNFSINGQSTDV